MKPVKGTVLIPLDQQPEESPQDPASVKVADSNLKSEDLFPTNEFIPTEEEKEAMSMTDEKFPTLDTNLFGSTPADSQRGRLDVEHQGSLEQAKSNR